MKVHILSALLLLVSTITSTPAAAEIGRARAEEIYGAAKVLCSQQAKNGDAYVDFISYQAKRLKYTDEEQILLFNYCLMYLQGRSDGLKGDQYYS